MNIKHLKKPLTYGYYFLSALSLVAIVGLFRPLRVKVFLLAISLLFCGYVVLKKRANLYRKSTKNEIIVALLFESFCFFDFYFNAIHIRPRTVMNLINMVFPSSLIDANAILAIIGFIACLIGFFFARTASQYLYCGLPKIFNILKEYKNQFIILSLVNVVSFIAIIRANYYYTDDLGRTLDGYEITGDFSRYVANILSEVIHANSWLADISPLPQIIALIFISITGILILHIFSELLDTKPQKWSFIALIPLCLSPYFLSCLSYKYDSPYMALSVLASVIPLIFYKSNYLRYSVCVFISTLVMCMTYQVSAGIFPMLVLIMGLLMWQQKTEYKKIFGFVFYSAISYLVALVVFRVMIMTPVEDNYVDVGISIGNIFPNLNTYISLVNSDFPTIWKVLIITILVGFILFIVKSSKQKKWISCLLTIVVCVCAFVLSFGVYIVFNEPLTTPRAFYSIGLFITLLSLPLFLTNGFKISKLSIISLSWMFIVYSFVYGNALNIQKEYIDFRTEQVVNEFNNLELLKEGEKLNVQVVGTAGYQRSVQNMIQEYPLLERQIPVLFSDSTEWLWGSFQFRGFYGLNTELVDVDTTNLSSENILKETYYYTIYKIDDVVVVDLHDVEAIASASSNKS